MARGLSRCRHLGIRVAASMQRGSISTNTLSSRGRGISMKPLLLQSHVAGLLQRYPPLMGGTTCSTAYGLDLKAGSGHGIAFLGSPVLYIHLSGTTGTGYTTPPVNSPRSSSATS